LRRLIAESTDPTPFKPLRFSLICSINCPWFVISTFRFGAVFGVKCGLMSDPRLPKSGHRPGTHPRSPRRNASRVIPAKNDNVAHAAGAYLGKGDLPVRPHRRIKPRWRGDSNPEWLSECDRLFI
jgi:hypothetical protein